MLLLYFVSFVLLLGVQCLSQPISFYSLPGIHKRSYSRLGDINVGVFVVTDYGTAESCWQQTRLSPNVIEQTAAVEFAVEYINRSPHILPNVTLGFVIQGICWAVGPTLASSLLFLPQSKLLCDSSNFNYTCEPTVKESDMSPYLGHDVIGVMSSGWSALTLPTSSLFAVAKLPLLGAVETSDEFSNKENHPYFFRISSPQSFLVQGMLKFIHQHGWSYISVLYTDCSFSLTTLIDGVKKYGICIATMHQLTKTSSNYDEVVSDLLVYSRARVVVCFISSSIFRNILRSVQNRNSTGHFLWFGYNLFDAYKGMEVSNISDKDPGIGALYFDTYSRGIPAFYDYLKNVNIYTTFNPWIKPIWESFLECSVNAGTCDTEANILESSKYRTYKGTALRVDGILTFAQAAHDLLSDKCAYARGREARACITGELFRDYLRNVSFDGFIGPVKLDKNQDIIGRYSIKQIIYDYPSYLYLSNKTKPQKQVTGKEIGTYDVATDAIVFSKDITWSHLTVLDRIVPWTSDSIRVDIIESVCSRPCLPGEYKIEKKVSCCWECRRCRDNERFINGNTSCKACPPFTWPDSATGLTTCTELPLTYSTLPDTIPVVLSTVAIIALLVTATTFVTYAIYRNERVIKASSRELSVIQLVAILVGYSTVLLFQTAPSDVTCGVLFFMFCMSFAMLYSPLLAKTSRIFRIFQSGSKNEKPCFISPQSQLLLTCCLLTIQITLCVLTYILYTPNAQKIQPVWTEKLVELSCDLTLPGFASFLGYNLVLVSLCSVFAFLTRKLPDNFNESKFISMCVSTTLLIWLAFIPTYFTASREFVRVFLLSVALLLNHSVALIFLFFPKIYAAVFLPESAGHVTNRSA